MTLWEAKGFWMRDNIHWPSPVRPLFVSYGLIPIEIGSARAYEEWSIPTLKNAYLVLHGYVYQRAEPLGGDTPSIMERFPFLFHLWRINPLLRKRVLGFENFLKEKGFEKHVDSWREKWEPEAKERLRPIVEFDREKAALGELADHLEKCYDYLCWSWNPHIKVVLVGMYTRHRWVEICQKLLNLTEFEAYELVQVSDPSIFNTTRSLLNLAKRAALDPDIRKILALPNKEALSRLSNTWFEKELRDFLDEEGDRPVDTFEFDPTWREMPEMVLGIIRGLADSASDTFEEEEDFQAYRLERIKELRSTLHQESQQEFDYWLSLAEKAQPLTEIHDYILANIPLANVRYDVLEVGKRWSESKLLDEPEDTLFLYKEELISFLRGKSDLGGIKALVSERKAEHNRNFSLNPPQTIGKPPVEPPWEVFPDLVADGMKLFMKQASQIEAQQEREVVLTPDGELFGTPGSPGVAEGPVRVIYTAEEFSLVKEGEILVCPFTTPTWTVLFPHVAALVTDSGGVLSHAAIVAREYRLPSVVGTIRGTKLLQNGQRVRVDGTAGRIQIL